MKKLISLLLALVMLLALCACGTGTDEPVAEEGAEQNETAVEPAAESAAEEKEAEAEPKTLTVGHASKTVDGFDPPTSGNEMGLYLVYDTLFARNPDNGNKIEGLLAVDYEYRDDCTLAVSINPDAVFTNGEPVTAADALYSLRRVMDSQSQYMDYYTCIDFDSSVAEDEHTLVLVTYNPTPMLLAYLALPYASVLCESYVEENGEEAFWDRPMGSGPYTCQENVSGSHTTYAAKADYWGEAAEYETITVNNYTDQTAMFVDFETGMIDVAFDMSASDAQRLQDGEMENANLIIAPCYNAISFAMPEYTEALSDIRVRQAICEAINIDAVAQVTFGVLCTPATSIVADGIDYHIDANGNRYNPEHAKELLAEAGYADGLTLKMVICAVDFQEKASTAIQAMLAEVGITLNVESYDIPTAVGMFMSGDTDVVINAQSAMALDPAQVFLTAASDSTNQTTALTDATFNEYLATGKTTLDTAERKTAYEAAQTWMAENYRQIPLADRAVAYAFSDALSSLNVVVPTEPNLRFAHAAE